MTHLRKMMLEELQRRNYAQNTIRHYIRTVEDFARRFRCSPDRLGPRQIREYQAELFQNRKLSANSVGQHLAALRFFYIKTLHRAWSLEPRAHRSSTCALCRSGRRSLARSHPLGSFPRQLLPAQGSVEERFSRQVRRHAQRDVSKWPTPLPRRPEASGAT